MGKSLTNILTFTAVAAVFACTLIGIFLVFYPSNSQEAYDSLVKILLVLGIVAVGSIITLAILKTASKK